MTIFGGDRPAFAQTDAPDNFAHFSDSDSAATVVCTELSRASLALSPSSEIERAILTNARLSVDRLTVVCSAAGDARTLCPDLFEDKICDVCLLRSFSVEEEEDELLSRVKIVAKVPSRTAFCYDLC